MLIDFLKEFVVIFVEMSPYILLGIFFVAVFNLFISKSFVAKHTGSNSIGSVIRAALFGVPLPLCSCGVIPTSVFLSKSGASKPAVVSFLISTPQTGVDSIIATYGMMGPIFAVFRPIAAFLMGIIGGIATILLGKEQQKETTAHNFAFEEIEIPKGTKAKVKSSLRYAFVEFIDDISVQFVVGLLVAALISFVVPDDFFTEAFLGNDLLGMLVVMILAIPMYVCATSSIPIAISLMMKGLSPAVAYVFLVAGPVSNAASIAILSKTIGKRTLGIYILSVAIFSIIFGYVLNWIFEVLGANPHLMMKHFHHHNTEFTIIEYILSLFFLFLLLSSFYRKNKQKFIKEKIMLANGVKKFKIGGMTCNHCVMNVQQAIKSVEGVERVEVNLAENSAIVEGTFEVDKIKSAVESIGYQFVGENN